MKEIQFIEKNQPFKRRLLRRQKTPPRNDICFVSNIEAVISLLRDHPFLALGSDAYNIEIFELPKK
jgi:hypothetical protein